MRLQVPWGCFANPKAGREDYYIISNTGFDNKADINCFLLGKLLGHRS